MKCLCCVKVMSPLCLHAILFSPCNRLRGTVPTEIGKLTFLSYTRFQKNGLVGEIPTELGNIALLRELWLWENGIEGKIPSELGLLTDMGKNGNTTLVHCMKWFLCVSKHRFSCRL